MKSTDDFLTSFNSQIRLFYFETETQAFLPNITSKKSEPEALSAEKYEIMVQIFY